jgi:Raf kinase inhibitor-like YbhB/YbcL family protein
MSVEANTLAPFAPVVRRVASALVLLAVAAGCKPAASTDHRDAATEDPAMATATTIELTSKSFQEGASIPKSHTGDGKDTSPALRWSDPPTGTRAFALICDDPDAPRRTWVHWVVYDLPADARALDEGMQRDASLASGAKQGKNDFGKTGYGGPAPPPGKPHRYLFKLYALDAPTGLPTGATKEQVLTAIKGHVLGEGQLMGRYGR